MKATEKLADKTNKFLFNSNDLARIGLRCRHYDFFSTVHESINNRASFVEWLKKITNQTGSNHPINSNN